MRFRPLPNLFYAAIRAGLHAWLAVAFAAAALLLMPGIDRPEMARPVVAAWILLIGVAMIRVLLAVDVRLADDGFTISNLYVTRHVRWDEVVAVQPSSHLLLPPVVELTLTSGKRIYADIGGPQPTRLISFFRQHAPPKSQADFRYQRLD